MPSLTPRIFADHPSRRFSPAMPQWGWGWQCCCDETGRRYHIAGGTGASSFYGDNDGYEIDTWTSYTNIVSPDRRESVGVNVGDAAHVIAGVASGAVLRDNDEYIPDTWTSRTDTPTPTRTWSSGFEIGSFSYIVAGITSGPTLLQDLDQYDASGDSWTSKTDCPTPARQMSGGAPANGKGYLYYGHDNTAFTSPIGDTDEYDPSGDAWANKTSGTNYLRGRGAYYGLNDLAYIAYGIETAIGGTATVDQDAYDPSGDSWGAKTGGPTPARRQPGSATPNNSSGYASGGIVSSTPNSDHDQYDGTGDTWQSRADIPTPARASSAGITPAE